MSLVKIKEYRLGKRGVRGAVMSLPRIYLQDKGLITGDKLELHRGSIEGYNDVLVIIPKNKETIPVSENSLAETL